MALTLTTRPFAVRTLGGRVDPFSEFDTMIRRAFPFASEAADVQKAAFSPATDLRRDGDDAVLTLDLPGLDFARDIAVELDGATLSVSGERRSERSESDEAGTRTLREVRYGSFRRSFTVPDGVTADQVSATYDAGVLAVRVAGAYATAAPAKIAVTAAPAAAIEPAATPGDESNETTD